MMGLNKIGVLLKSVLIDLHAHNFIHTKTYLHARCMHACQCAHNLLSPVTELYNMAYIAEQRISCLYVSKLRLPVVFQKRTFQYLNLLSPLKFHPTILKRHPII